MTFDLAKRYSFLNKVHHKLSQRQVEKTPSSLTTRAQGNMAIDVSPTYISLKVSSSLSSFASEKRYPTSTLIGDLKGKLELITGATAGMMQLQLYDDDSKLLCELDKDSSPLQAYPVQDGYRIHVINKDPTKVKGEFEDTSGVEKYEMSADDYSKKSDSVLAFKKRMKLGRFADTDPEAEANAAAKVEEERQLAESITVGARCEVTLPGATPKKGVVMFVGTTHFKPGYWIGVKYDEPVGKNNGSVEGKRYFECPPKYGAFTKPKNVQVGDFPEETFSDDEM